MYLIMYFVTKADDIIRLSDLINDLAPLNSINWKQFGIVLGLHNDEIDEIAKKNLKSSGNECREMLTQWMQKDAKPTWSKIHKAIESTKSKLYKYCKMIRCH